MKNPRTTSREVALQSLFYMDMRKNTSPEVLTLFCENFTVSEQSLSFFLELVNGITSAMSEIDAVIERFSDNWKISRMSCVDRNAIRMAAYEMLYREDIPVKVSINEAINLGKKYGSEDSGAFINGVLDSIRIALEKKELNCLRPET